jgi:3'-phosphoadenosine 5'-phosphosulfate sulfotransferase (PAPS reductase)/FAD synthetase
MKHSYYVSGGKDSVAMLIKSVEDGCPVDNIYFMDTGLEFPEMYDYINKIEDYVDHEIVRILPHKNFYEQFYKIHRRGKYSGEIWGFPRATYPCWIQRDLKCWDKVLVAEDFKYVGIAYDERARLDRKMYDETFRFPLVEWKMSEQDCLDFLNDRDMLNPLYNYFDRLGCWLCPRQRIESLRSLWRMYPDLWAELLRLEADCPHGFRTDWRLNDLARRFEMEGRLVQLDKWM